jgi:CRISPR system Cascade subunit CasE
MADPTVHLWRLGLKPAQLARIAKEQNIRIHDDEDHGYTIHALLCGLFGKAQAPKPWRLDTQRSVLWAYAPQPLDATAAALADPLYHAAIDWERSASRQAPVLASGTTVAFDLRACPVVRRGGRGDQRASEHDALLWQAQRDGVAVGTLDPALVYADWLRQRAWTTAQGADLGQVTVVGWSKPAMQAASTWRGRGDGRLRLPDAHFSGILTITDSEAFLPTLARGIGRHRAFGYGMLLLRPVSA